MSSIDFLPADYVCAQSRRWQSRWRRLALVILTTLVALGGVNESYRQIQAEQTRLTVTARLRTLTRQLPDATGLQTRLEAAEREADVIARLELAIRPSRVLAVVTGALPPGIHLTHLGLKFEPSPRFDPALLELAERLPPRDERLPAPLASGEASAVPARDVLQVTLQGVAGDDEQIATLLNQLEATGLFAGIQLRRIERSASASDEARTFHLQLTVEPPELFRTTPAPRLSVWTLPGDGQGLDLPETLSPRRQP